MCLNCGCDRLNDQMNDPKNIIWDQVKAAAVAGGMSLEDTVAEIKRMMDKGLEEEKKAS